jgi:Na+/proline symporter
MLSAKDEKNAVGATLLFNIAHYALRPWPWILIALASIIVFPDLESLRQAFPNINEQVVKDDLAFPAMLTYLPSGLLGLVIASLIAAFMSTLSTHLNWGASYIVHDFYRRFINEKASEKTLVRLGRWSTVGLMVLTALFALVLENALQAFNILLQIGAGTGLIFILRWFWWRINAYSEIAAMVVSFLMAIYLEVLHPGELASHTKLLLGVGVTTASWIIVTFLTPPTDHKTLLSFYQLIKPSPGGWRPVIDQAKAEGALTEADVVPGKLPMEIAAMVIACFTVYAALFATGFWIYGNTASAIVATGVAATGSGLLMVFWRRLNALRQV